MEHDDTSNKRQRESDMNEIQRQSRDSFNEYLDSLIEFKPPKKQKKNPDEERQEIEEVVGPKFDHEAFDPFVEYDKITLEV
jgi:hypothetical protein